jgi:polyphosphate kinase
MIRNLDRRVEVAVPVLDPDLKKRVIDEVLGLALGDNVKARRVLATGGSERIVRAEGETPIRSQLVLLELASKPEPQGDGLLAPAKKGKKKRRRQ